MRDIDDRVGDPVHDGLFVCLLREPLSLRAKERAAELCIQPGSLIAGITGLQFVAAIHLSAPAAWVSQHR